jgi:hypothetical protein
MPSCVVCVYITYSCGASFLLPSLSRRPQLVAVASSSLRLLSGMSETDNLAARNFRHVIPLCADGRDVTLITPNLRSTCAHYNAEYIKIDKNADIVLCFLVKLESEIGKGSGIVQVMCPIIGKWRLYFNSNF